jgi:hypothetical protein
VFRRHHVRSRGFTIPLVGGFAVVVATVFEDPLRLHAPIFKSTVAHNYLNHATSYLAGPLNQRSCFIASQKPIITTSQLSEPIGSGLDWLATPNKVRLRPLTNWTADDIHN